MPQSSDNGARSPMSKDGRSTPVWRATFDAIERPVARASESWLQSETFMDGLALVWKLQRGLNRQLRGGLATWFGAWNISTGSDVNRLENQIAGLERQVRGLRDQLERAGLGGAPDASERGCSAPGGAPDATDRESSANRR